MKHRPHSRARRGAARPRAAGALALAFLAASCASYPERTADALSAFSRGQLDRAYEELSDPDVTDGDFLRGVEAGTVALAAGRFEVALEDFTRAAGEVRELEERALVSPDNLAEDVGSWVLSDSSQSYEGEGFERVLMHASLGLSYLALGLVDDFGVEVRLANRLLETEEALYEKEYRAGGLGHFLSAVYYELRGEPDQAYIDYLRMEEKGVGVSLAGAALVRLARRLGREDEVARWDELYGSGPMPDPDAASVVVVAGVGLGPYKVEQKLTLPLRGGLFSMAAPSLVARSQSVTGLRLVVDGWTTVRTDVVEDVTAVTKENLADRVALIAAKSAARGILKRELTKELEKEHGLAGRVAGDLFSLFTERADLRAWMTLPDTWQACRVFVPPGAHELALEAIGGERVDLGTLHLEPGETVFVLARNVRQHLFAHAIGGGRIPEPLTASP